MNNRRGFLKKVFNYSCFFSVLGVLQSLFISDSLTIRFIDRRFYSMGTDGNIQIYTKDDIFGKRILEGAINRIKNIEDILTKFFPNSCIGKINNNSLKYVEVTTDAVNVLKLGMNITKLTYNHFDMGMGNLLYSAGIDDCVPLIGNVTTVNDIKCDLLKISGNKVKLNRRNVMLDLGGIGKGYAIDLAASFLLKNNIKHFAINLGGDIKVNGGKPDGSPWRISIDKKISCFLKNKLSDINLFNGSIAVTGSYLKKSKINDNNIKHHIIDPNSLISKNYYSLVIVKGNMASICDALSTACYNMNNKYLLATKYKFTNYSINTYV